MLVYIKYQLHIWREKRKLPRRCELARNQMENACGVTFAGANISVAIGNVEEGGLPDLDGTTTQLMSVLEARDNNVIGSDGTKLWIFREFSVLIIHSLASNFHWQWMDTKIKLNQFASLSMWTPRGWALGQLDLCTCDKANYKRLVIIEHGWLIVQS